MKPYMATQRFALFDILVQHCGQRLDAATIEKIIAEMVEEMRNGPTAWAFKLEQA